MSIFREDLFDQKVEVLNEVTSYSGGGISICVDGSGFTDRNYHLKPYFKVYNGENRQKASKVARIYFDEPKYVYPEHSDGKQVWYFNSTEKKLFVKTLTDKVWQKMNNDLLRVCKNELNSGFNEIPDYSLLRKE